MVLIIGGYAQGKDIFARINMGFADDKILDLNELISNYLEKELENLTMSQTDLEALVEAFVEKISEENPDAAFISDEVGNGIVPMDKKKRILRELIGRGQCIAAKKASEVYRVICGIGQRIK